MHDESGVLRTLHKKTAVEVGGESGSGYVESSQQSLASSSRLRRSAYLWQPAYRFLKHCSHRSDVLKGLRSGNEAIATATESATADAQIILIAERS